MKSHSTSQIPNGGVAGVFLFVCVVTRANITSLEHNQDTKHNKQQNTEHYKLSPGLQGTGQAGTLRPACLGHKPVLNMSASWCYYTPLVRCRLLHRPRTQVSRRTLLLGKLDDGILLLTTVTLTYLYITIIWMRHMRTPYHLCQFLYLVDF